MGWQMGASVTESIIILNSDSAVRAFASNNQVRCEVKGKGFWGEILRWKRGWSSNGAIKLCKAGSSHLSVDQIIRRMSELCPLNRDTFVSPFTHQDLGVPCCNADPSPKCDACIRDNQHGCPTPNNTKIGQCGHTVDGGSGASRSAGLNGCPLRRQG